MYLWSTGPKVTTLSLSGKVNEVILLIMAIDKAFENNDLTNFIGSLSVPAAFSEFKDLTFFLPHLK